MDSLQTTVTSLAVIAIVVLMVVFVCHYLGPRASAWVRSNREEKIGLSKSKLFNANGYMIHSGSDFLLSSSGSFKRFDSIDRDYKQVGQSSLTSPAWNLPPTDIPPQPLRPAPAPVSISTKCREVNEKATKPKSLEAEHISTVIPRPVTKRQLSTPVKSSTVSNSLDHGINLTDVVQKIQNSSRSSTNPFLNGSLVPLAERDDNPTKNEKSGDSENQSSLKNVDIKEADQKTEKEQEHYDVRIYKRDSKNPFTADCIRISKENAKNDEFNVVLKEPPKTDVLVDRKNIFNFEPENITSILDRKITTLDEEDLPLNGECTDKEDESSTEQFPTLPPHLQEIQRLQKQQDLILQQLQKESAAKDTSKFADSPCADAFENIEKMLKNHFRNRSFSETEATESDLQMIAKDPEFLKTNSTNPFIGNNVMHKTFSENYLARTNYQTWSFGRSLSRQESSSSLGKFSNSSQNSLDGDRGSLDSVNLQRALSCDSVSSESSVVLADLEQLPPPVTGYLCVGLQYDKNSVTDEGMELIVTVMEAKDLISPHNVENFDTFVRIYLVPDESGAMQTKLFKNSSCPSYNETFCFWIRKKRSRRSLWFHLYHSGSAHTLIGEAEMQICDVTRPITTWLALSDSRQNSANWGELMFSLSYLPTAERLTVVVVKARNLKLDQDGREAIDFQNIFVKVYLLKDDKKVSKKKTSLKRIDRCPIFNESMIFSIPPYVLNTVQVRLTVMSMSDTELLPIGHVIVGGNTSGKGLRHWHQMLSSLRKPVAMWHALRRTNTKGRGDAT